MSSTALSKERIAELVKCVLCMKTFTSPQTMKCLHTFCKHCLEHNAKRSSVDDIQGLECPRCKHFTAQRDVIACTRTEQLVELSQSSTKRQMCFQCETESSEWKCQDCGDFYCEACKQMHFKIKKFKDHKFLDVQNSQDVVTLHGTVQCSKHSTEEVKGFCFDCDVLLCSLCLLEGHGTHKRDTVHNAVDHVNAKVDEKLAAIKQITNERFLRAEKLKDTRLLIQTYAEESFDTNKTRYEVLKRKLEEDYETLMDDLKTSVDAELEKVNTVIVAEEAKQSHATAVTSYVENTLAISAGARNIQESLEELIPTMTQFCAEHGVEPFVTSHIYRYNKTESSQHGSNLIGKIDTISADFHSRYQPLITEAKFQGAVVGRTIDIDLGRETQCYRISVGFGQIVACFYKINKIRIYDVDGSDFQELKLSKRLDGPTSAVFVNKTQLVVAADYGLAVVDVATSKIVANLNDQPHYDVFHMDNRIYAIREPGRHDIYEDENLDWKIVKSMPVGADESSRLSGFATVVVSRSTMYFCNNSNKVLQYSLSGELQQTLTVDDRMATSASRFLCAVDFDGRILLSVGDQLVLRHNDQSQVVKLKGVTEFQDIVFSDQYTFWIMDVISYDDGKSRLVKYNLA